MAPFMRKTELKTWVLEQNRSPYSLDSFLPCKKRSPPMFPCMCFPFNQPEKSDPPTPNGMPGFKTPPCFAFRALSELKDQPGGAHRPLPGHGAHLVRCRRGPPGLRGQGDVRGVRGARGAWGFFAAGRVVLRRKVGGSSVFCLSS